MKRFEVGARVQEPTYGLGSIIAVEDAFVRIQFDDKAVRKFLLRLARLQHSNAPAPPSRSRARKRKTSTKSEKLKVAVAPKVDMKKAAAGTAKSSAKRSAKKGVKEGAKKTTKKTTKKTAKKGAKKVKKATKSGARKKLLAGAVREEKCGC